MISGMAPQLVHATVGELERRLPDMQTYTDAQRRHTTEDIGYIVDFLGAALYTDDDDLFSGFISWTSDVLSARGVPPAALPPALDVLLAQLPDFPRAQRILRTARIALAAKPPTPPLRCHETHIDPRHPAFGTAANQRKSGFRHGAGASRQRLRGDCPARPAAAPSPGSGQPRLLRLSGPVGADPHRPTDRRAPSASAPRQSARTARPHPAGDGFVRAFRVGPPRHRVVTAVRGREPKTRRWAEAGRVSARSPAQVRR